VNEALLTKADVSDVSKAVSDVIQATAFDYRPDLEEMRSQISLRATKQDLSLLLKA
jgi:hypothetical protein